MEESTSMLDILNNLSIHYPSPVEDIGPYAFDGNFSVSSLFHGLSYPLSSIPFPRKQVWRSWGLLKVQGFIWKVALMADRLQTLHPHHALCFVPQRSRIK